MYALVGHGQKTILPCTGRVNDLPARHDVRVDIDGIDRIGHHHGVVGAENIADIARVGLCAVADKDLIRSDCYSKARVISCDRLASEIIALILGIALEGLLDAHLVGAVLHRSYSDRRQRERHVADAEPDELLLRMSSSISRGLFRYLGKEIVRD